MVTVTCMVEVVCGEVNSAPGEVNRFTLGCSVDCLFGEVHQVKPLQAWQAIVDSQTSQTTVQMATSHDNHSSKAGQSLRDKYNIAEQELSKTIYSRLYSTIMYSKDTVSTAVCRQQLQARGNGETDQIYWSNRSQALILQTNKTIYQVIKPEEVTKLIYKHTAYKKVNSYQKRRYEYEPTVRIGFPRVQKLHASPVITSIHGVTSINGMTKLHRVCRRLHSNSHVMIAVTVQNSQASPQDSISGSITASHQLQGILHQSMLLSLEHTTC